jgi:hypothetical protein
MCETHRHSRTSSSVKVMPRPAASTTNAGEWETFSAPPREKNITSKATVVVKNKHESGTPQLPAKPTPLALTAANDPKATAAANQPAATNKPAASAAPTTPTSTSTPGINPAVPAAVAAVLSTIYAEQDQTYRTKPSKGDRAAYKAYVNWRERSISTLYFSLFDHPLRQSDLSGSNMTRVIGQIADKLQTYGKGTRYPSFLGRGKETQ